jgi:hypothetical protein
MKQVYSWPISSRTLAAMTLAWGAKARGRRRHPGPIFFRPLRVKGLFCAPAGRAAFLFRRNPLECESFQIPPDFVVKSQAIDVAEVILALIRQLNLVSTLWRNRQSRRKRLSISEAHGSTTKADGMWECRLGWVARKFLASIRTGQPRICTQRDRDHATADALMPSYTLPMEG